MATAIHAVSALIADGAKRSRGQLAAVTGGAAIGRDLVEVGLNSSPDHTPQMRGLIEVTVTMAGAAKELQ